MKKIVIRQCVECPYSAPPRGKLGEIVISDDVLYPWCKYSKRYIKTAADIPDWCLLEDEVDSGNLLVTIKKYFENCRFDDKLHLGLGDIRMTIGMQEEVLKIIAKATGQKFDGI